jgi:hypothetical protein
MTNLRFVVGLGLLGGFLAATVMLMRPQPKSPRPAAAAGDAAALTRAAELMQRGGALPVMKPARVTEVPPASAVPPVPQASVRLNDQGIPVTSAAMQNQIRNNLRTLTVARNMFLKERGRLPASLDELVGPGGAVAALAAVNGEVYTGLDLGGARLVVTAADGIEVVLENVAPRPYGPPTQQESMQWEAELATYATSADLTKAREEGAVSEHQAALFAVAEVMKREGWDTGVKVFRPERMGDAWFVQLNHVGQREENGKRVAWGQYASMYINDQGAVSRYELGKVRVAPLE